MRAAHILATALVVANARPKWRADRAMLPALATLPRYPTNHTQTHTPQQHTQALASQMAEWPDGCLTQHATRHTRTQSTPPRSDNFPEYFAAQCSEIPAHLPPLCGASTPAHALLRCAPSLQASARQHARSLGTQAHERAHEHTSCLWHRPPRASNARLPNASRTASSAAAASDASASPAKRQRALHLNLDAIACNATTLNTPCCPLSSLPHLLHLQK